MNLPIPKSEEFNKSMKTIKSASRDCHELAKETSTLCISTASKGQEIVNFGHEINETLTKLTHSSDGASVLNTIRDLINGNNVTRSIELAREMETLSVSCVSKSSEMLSRMQDGINALPKSIRKMILSPSFLKPNDEELERGNVDSDVDDLIRCMDAIENLNLFTAMKAGRDAFEGLTSKSSVCREMVGSIRDFSESVVGITDAFIRMDIGKVFGKVKEIGRCVRLFGLMKQYSEEVGRLLRKIIELFTSTSSKFGKLWSSLSYAKDCMMECVSFVTGTRDLCLEGEASGDELKEKALSIDNQLFGGGGGGGDGEIRTRSFSLQSFNVSSEDIKVAIELANNIERDVRGCTTNVSAMLEKVIEGYDNLPDIVTDGMPDLDNEDAEAEGEETEEGEGEEGEGGDDIINRKLVLIDVEDDIRELQEAQDLLENSNLFSDNNTFSTERSNFTGLSNKVAKCNQIVRSLESFTMRCSNTIESFMSTWDLEDMQTKIMDMCKLVRLGRVMKEMVDRVKKLLDSVLGFLFKLTTKSPQHILEGAVAEAVKFCNPTEFLDGLKKLV